MAAESLANSVSMTMLLAFLTSAAGGIAVPVILVRAIVDNALKKSLVLRDEVDKRLRSEDGQEIVDKIISNNDKVKKTAQQVEGALADYIGVVNRFTNQQDVYLQNQQDIDKRMQRLELLLTKIESRLEVEREYDRKKKHDD